MIPETRRLCEETCMILSLRLFLYNIPTPPFGRPGKMRAPESTPDLAMYKYSELIVLKNLYFHQDAKSPEYIIYHRRNNVNSY